MASAARNSKTCSPAAKRMGVRAVTINSVNRDDWHTVEAALARNEVDLLLISPERLANEHFRTGVIAPIAGKISLLVVDEAHCISDWVTTSVHMAVSSSASYGRCPRISEGWRPRLWRTTGCSLTWRWCWGRISRYRAADRMAAGAASVAGLAREVLKGVARKWP